MPIEIESNNPTLLPNSHPCRILSTPTEPSSEVPKFSYVPSNTLNNKVFSEVPQLTDGNVSILYLIYYTVIKTI